MRSVLFSVSMLLFLLTGCGFTPLYTAKNNDKITDKTAQIYILPIPEESGYFISSILTDRLNPEKKQVSKVYNLAVKLDQISYADQMIQENNLSTRKKITIRISYILSDTTSGKTLINTALSAGGAYNILTSPYATTIDQEQNERDLIQILANDIATHIITYFKTQEYHRES